MEAGYRTADIMGEQGGTLLSCSAMTEKILAATAAEQPAKEMRTTDRK